MVAFHRAIQSINYEECDLALARGIGVILLKKLSDVVRDKDNIYAIIKVT